MTSLPPARQEPAQGCSLQSGPEPIIANSQKIKTIYEHSFLLNCSSFHLNADYGTHTITASSNARSHAELFISITCNDPTLIGITPPPPASDAAY